MAKRTKAATRRKGPGFAAGEFAAPQVEDYVIAELEYDSGLVITSAGRLEGAALAEAPRSKLLDKLEHLAVKRMTPLFDLPRRVLASRALGVASPKAKVSSEFAQSGFMRIELKDPRHAAKAAAAIAKSKGVWQAYVAPRPVPAAMATGSSTGSRNFEPAQGYLHSAPNGIDAMGIWGFMGGKGRGVTVCDIEGNWNFKHEDLPTVTLLGGTPIPTLDWRDHGTAVLGEIVGRPGEKGVVGIANQARAFVHSAVIGGVFNTAGAIMGAAAKLKAGDVILIELQAVGPNDKYVAMQYWDDVFAAIRAVTARGITVVEAAGNGDENFDLPIFAGTGLQKDSGAIVVGAGVPPTNYFDSFGFGGGLTSYNFIGVPRSRIWFSNYGKIVNVQGWGWHVTSAGYGDAQGGSSENRWYTHRFSGTSSASPIVTGAVACLQGLAKARHGAPLTPGRVRDILMRTGTPQEPGPGVPLSQKIGPLPNLKKAEAAV